MRKLIFFLIVLVGFGVLNYPYLSSRYREEQQKQLAMELLEQQESEPSEPLELAQQYNEALAAAGQVLDDAFAQAQEGSGQQEDEEILGFVEIPKIEQYLPIYEGTSPAILNKGVGHLTGSSLPVGGESTHAVLAGHSGLASQLIFTDLEQLELGDTFYLHSLGQTLAYRVDQILTVNPWETEELQVQEGRDLVPRQRQNQTSLRPGSWRRDPRLQQSQRQLPPLPWPCHPLQRQELELFCLFHGVKQRLRGLADRRDARQLPISRVLLRSHQTLHWPSSTHSRWPLRERTARPYRIP